MALDAAVADLLVGELISGTRLSAARIAVIGENALQALAVVQTVSIQQAASVVDDAATMASLRTAIHIPVAGGEKV